MIKDKERYRLYRNAYNDGYIESGEITLAYIFDDLSEYADENWGYIETHPKALGDDDPFYKYLRNTYPIIFRYADSSDQIIAEKIVFMGKAKGQGV